MKKELTQLVELWHKACTLKNARDWQSAARLYERILLVQPDWEHGYGYFNLAECYEEIGRINDAHCAYERAVCSTPTDQILLGGFASFLYLYGEPSQAFDQYTRLLILDKKCGDDDGVAKSMTALRSLGSRLGWSAAETESKIAKAIATFIHDSGKHRPLGGVRKIG